MQSWSNIPSPRLFSKYGHLLHQHGLKWVITCFIAFRFLCILLMVWSNANSDIVCTFACMSSRKCLDWWQYMIRGCMSFRLELYENNRICARIPNISAVQPLQDCKTACSLIHSLTGCRHLSEANTIRWVFPPLLYCF